MKQCSRGILADDAPLVHLVRYLDSTTGLPPQSIYHSKDVEAPQLCFIDKVVDAGGFAVAWSPRFEDCRRFCTLTDRLMCCLCFDAKPSPFYSETVKVI